MEKNFGVFMYEPLETKQKDLITYIVWNDSALKEPFIVELSEIKEYPKVIDALVSEKQQLFLIQSVNKQEALGKFESYQVIGNPTFDLEAIKNLAIEKTKKLKL